MERSRVPLLVPRRSTLCCNWSGRSSPPCRSTSCSAPGRCNIPPLAVAAVVIVGKGFMVTVKAFPALLQPLPLVTVSVPVYVPATTPAAIGTVIGLAGNAVDGTFTSPAASAAAFHVMV
jgi:hypothetical protein